MEIKFEEIEFEALERFLTDIENGKFGDVDLWDENADYSNFDLGVK